MSKIELSAAPVPPLVQGDHLSRDEFERRYEAMPGVKKAELIEGVVYMPSPVRWNKHASPHSAIQTWVGTYWFATPGTQAGDNVSIRLDLKNESQPDAVLMILPSHGGQARISADDYLEGGPELVIEVAASSVSFDLNTKLRIYLRNGVREYIVWRVLQQQIDWFVLRDGRFDPLTPNAAGWLCSVTFPGLWLDPAALTRHDFVRVMDVLQEGLRDPWHAAFVAELSRCAEGTPLA